MAAVTCDSSQGKNKAGYTLMLSLCSSRGIPSSLSSCFRTVEGVAVSRFRVGNSCFSLVFSIVTSPI